MTRRAARPASFPLSLALCLAVAISAGAGDAFASAFELNDESWQGCSELLSLARAEIGADRVVLASALDWNQLRPSDGVVALHPLHALDPEESEAFMKAGGRLAIVDDYGRGDRLLSHFKIHRVDLPAYPAQFLHGNREIPIATPALDSADGQILGLHPTVADVRMVVLNHATGLTHPDLTPVLEVRGSRSPSDTPDQVVTVAVAGQVGQGRLFAMGDPSAFINLMLRYQGNRKLAGGLLHYLADGDVTGSRHGRLFILANDFDERGSFGGVTPFRKSLDRRLQAVAELLAEVRDHGFPWWVQLGLAAACALGLLGWALSASLRVYTARLPRFARETPLVAQGGAAGRYAVLASRASPPALALLELRAALSEGLAMELDAPTPSPLPELIELLRVKVGIEAALQERATRVIALMRAAESVVVGGGGRRINRRHVLDAGEVSAELLARAGLSKRDRASVERV